jgi:hypothetical protein
VRLVSCYYDADGRREWVRMARVLELTAGQHCATWHRSVDVLSPAARASATGIDVHLANTHKLEAWRDQVHRAVDGERLLLIDADTVILRSLDDIWSAPFDMAFATKRHMFPFNLGVIFVRVSGAVRRLFDAWVAENAYLLARFDPNFQRQWRSKYGGINQAAFGRLQERDELADVAMHHLNCREWNCEESAWERFDPRVTRILHVKSALRRQVFNREPVSRSLRGLVDLWRELDQRAALARTA